MERVPQAAVAYASVGSGHRIAAEVVAVRLERRGLLRIPPIDALQHGVFAMSGDFIARLGTGRLAPLYDSLWFDERRAKRPGMLDGVLAKSFHPLTRALSHANVDVVACTHALPAIVLARARRRGEFDARVVAVLTDFDAHSQWPVDLDAYCVPHDRARNTLLSRAIPTERVAVTGIPLRPGFDEPCVARTPEGAPPHVLIIAGAPQQGLHRRVREALPLVLDSARQIGARATIVTGTHGALESLVGPSSDDLITLVAHTSEVARLMSAADVFVGKPGGLVCAEALARQLPMVLVGPVFGQERANAELLTGAGVAILAENAPSLAGSVARLLADPELRASMKAAARPLHHPHATETVSELLARVCAW